MPSPLWKLSRARPYTGPERRKRRLDFKALFVAAMVLAVIAFATLCPIELRPRLGSADAERFGAYLLLGLCATFAAPRRPAMVIFAVTMAAGVLEAGQLLVPGRDAHFSDACVKAMGGVVGAFAGQASYAVRRRLAEILRNRRSGARHIYTG